MDIKQYFSNIEKACANVVVHAGKNPDSTATTGVTNEGFQNGVLFGNQDNGGMRVHSVMSEDPEELASNLDNIVIDFLNDNSITSKTITKPESFDSDRAFEDFYATRSISSDITNVGAIDAENIVKLVREAGISEEHIFGVACEVAMAINNELASGDIASSINKLCAGTGADVETLNAAVKFSTNIMPPSLRGSGNYGDVNDVIKTAVTNESFGKNIDEVKPDIRTTITGVFMRYHTSRLACIYHTRNTPSSIIEYLIPIRRVYFLSKSADERGEVRDTKQNNIDTINLYHNPGILSTRLRRVVPLKANDATGEYLVDDGLIKFDQNVNLFDVSRDARDFQNNDTDHTDLIDRRVTMDHIAIGITLASKKEQLIVDFSKDPRTSMFNTTMGSPADLYVTHRGELTVTSDTPVTGGTSEHFKTLTGGQFIVFDYRLRVDINIRTSVVNASLTGRWSAGKIADGAHAVTPTETTLALVKALNAANATVPEFFNIDARYSEENFRKVDVAVKRTKVRRLYALQSPRFFSVENSIEQITSNTTDDSIGDVAAIATIIKDKEGMDHTSETLNHIETNYVPATMRADNSIPESGLEYAFPTGNKVIPYARKIDISLVNRIKTLKDSEYDSDLSAYVLRRIVQGVSQMHANSLYTQALVGNKEAVYTGYTSNVIMTNCLSSHHTYAHLDAIMEPDAKCELRLRLKNDVILRLVTTPDAAYSDKLVIVPYIPNAPESPLNGGHNWKRGTTTARFNVAPGKVHHRTVMAVASDVLTTTPIGLQFNFPDLEQALELEAENDTMIDNGPLSVRVANADELKPA